MGAAMLFVSVKDPGVFGTAALRRVHHEQMNMIAPAFDLPYWVKKFKENPADVALVKEICKETGIA